MALVKSSSGRPFAVALFFLTLAVYLPAMRGGYLWDDDAHLTGDEKLKSIGGLAKTWFVPTSSQQYYPLVHTSFWLEYQLWKLNPTGYHVDNILLHGLNAVLLGFLLRRLKVPGAWWVAALFAVHPVHVESVAWISERKNVLSGFFYLSAATAYYNFAFPDSPLGSAGRRRVFYFLAVVFYIAALLSKTVTASLPAAILLVLWWKRQRLTWRDVAPLVPLFVIGAVLGLFTAHLERTHLRAEGPDWDFSFVERCLIAGRALWFYASKIFLPVNQAFIYPRWQIDAGLWWQYLFPLSAFVFLAVLWRLRSRIGCGSLVAVLYFAGTLFPALGFLNFYPMRLSFVADHFQYLASIGLIGLLVAGAIAWADRLDAQRLRRGGSLILLIVLSGLTWQRAQLFTDREVLWNDTLRKNPNAWIAHLNMASDFTEQGRLREALAHYRGVLAIAAKARPRDRTPLLRGLCADVHNNMGLIFQSQGKTDAAVEAFREALAADPRHTRARYSLGNWASERGDWAEAAKHFQVMAEQLEEEIDQDRPPDERRLPLAEAHRRLGEVFWKLGKIEQAIPHYRRAIEIVPSHLAAMNGLAWLLATSAQAAPGSANEAINLAEKACSATGYTEPTFLDTLAAAYASAGRFQDAVQTAEGAVGIARESGREGLAKKIEARLARYRNRRPYVE